MNPNENLSLQNSINSMERTNIVKVFKSKYKHSYQVSVDNQSH